MLVFGDLRKIDRYEGHGDRGIGQGSRSNLIAAAARTVRAFVHGLADQPAHSDGHIADADARDDAEGGVADQSEDGGSRAEEQRAHESGVAVYGNLALQSKGAIL